MHDRLLCYPACSFRSLSSIQILNRFNMIRLKILLGTDGRVIPLQFLQFVTSPFLGSFTNGPFFQSSDTTQVLHIFTNSGWSSSIVTPTSSLSTSGGMLSIPGALPFFDF
jgi:hypothetical protein